jgi:hypothetical protein
MQLAVSSTDVNLIYDYQVIGKGGLTGKVPANAATWNKTRNLA